MDRCMMGCTKNDGMSIQNTLQVHTVRPISSIGGRASVSGGGSNLKLTSWMTIGRSGIGSRALVGVSGDRLARTNYVKARRVLVHIT